MLRPALALVLTLSAFAALAADDVSVQPATPSIDQPVRIVVAIDDPGDAPDRLSLNLDNLTLVGEPTVSQAGAWVPTPSGGKQYLARKTYVYDALPRRPGAAIIAVSYTRKGGSAQTDLPPKRITIAEPPRIDAARPLETLQSFRAAGLEPVFIAAEIAPDEVFVGQQIVVTWSAFAHGQPAPDAAEAPSITGAEVHALPRADASALQGGAAVTRIPLASVAVVAREAGAIEIPPFETSFRISEKRVARASAPVSVTVHDIEQDHHFVADATATFVAVGKQLANTYDIDVEVSAREDLRKMPPPRFDGALASQLLTEERETTFTPTADGVRTTRRWLLRVAGGKERITSLPPLVVRRFDPDAEKVVPMLWRAGAVNLPVGSSTSTAAPEDAQGRPMYRARNLSPDEWLGCGVAALFLALLIAGVFYVYNATR